jgi:hypothetical protein
MPLADSSLETIRTKIRRLVRAPSISQLSDNDIDEYINTFVIYDIPANLKLFNLRRTLTFYTQPGVDVYRTIPAIPANAGLVNDPLYNFKNKYTAIHQPVFFAGIQGFYTQWRDVFYGYYPQTATIAMTQIFGDGGMGPFNSTLISPPPNVPPQPFILQKSVNFNCVTANNQSMVMVDVPISNIIGNLTPPNTPLVPPYDTMQNPGNYINYLTGQFSVTFPNNTVAQAPIWFEAVLYQPGKPIAMLYFNDEFTIRPVPDKTYAIQMEVDALPTQLLADTDTPELEQWWQYIAYGAAKKIFEDKMDTDSVEKIFPEFKNQEYMVLYTTLTQRANERSVTIYTQGKNYGFGWFGPGGWPY